MTHVTCRLTAKDRDQLRNTTLGNRVWATFLVWCHHEKSSVVWCGVSTPHPHYFSRGCGVVLLSAWCAWRLYEGWHSWATVDYSRSPAVVFRASTHLFSGLTSRTFSSVDYCCAAVNIRRTHVARMSEVGEDVEKCPSVHLFHSLTHPKCHRGRLHPVPNPSLNPNLT